MTNETVVVGSAADSIREEAVRRFCEGGEFCSRAVDWIAGRWVDFTLNVVGAVLILVLGSLSIRLIVAAVRKAVARDGKRKTLLVDFTANAVSKVCWAVLAVIVLSRLGIDVGPIIAGLGVTGFILGFAFQESLGNLASGLMIAINEPFKVGDYVSVAGLEGSVLKVDMMATVLATADNKKVVIPNKSAWGAPIVNFSALGKRRVDIRIGIDYGSDVVKAVKIATEVLLATPGVLADPAPQVTIASLDDSQVTLNVRPWANGEDYWDVFDVVQREVKAAFERGGVDIPFPQLVVHTEK